MATKYKQDLLTPNRCLGYKKVLRIISLNKGSHSLEGVIKIESHLKEESEAIEKVQKENE
jgi:hypothetical protein